MSKDLLKFKENVKKELLKTSFKNSDIEVTITLLSKERVIYRITLLKENSDWESHLVVSDSSVSRVIQRLLFELKMQEEK